VQLVEFNDQARATDNGTSIGKHTIRISFPTRTEEDCITSWIRGAYKEKECDSPFRGDQAHDKSKLTASNTHTLYDGNAYILVNIPERKRPLGSVKLRSG
jgi:hypothetical protein